MDQKTASLMLLPGLKSNEKQGKTAAGRIIKTPTCRESWGFHRQSVKSIIKYQVALIMDALCDG